MMLNFIYRNSCLMITWKILLHIQVLNSNDQLEIIIKKNQIFCCVALHINLNSIRKTNLY